MNRTLQDDLDSYFDEVEVRSIEIGLSEKLARGRHANFDEVIALVFREMAEDGELRRQLLSQVVRVFGARDLLARANRGVLE